MKLLASDYGYFDSDTDKAIDADFVPEAALTAAEHRVRVLVPRS